MEQALNCKQFNGKVPMAIWQRIYPFVKEACTYSRGEYTPDDILEGIEDGRYQLWLAYKGDEIVWAWTSQILNRSGHKIAFINMAGGSDLSIGMKFWPLMRCWMKEYKLQEMEAQCRPSFARLLKRKAKEIRTKYEVLTIELED